MNLFEKILTDLKKKISIDETKLGDIALILSEASDTKVTASQIKVKKGALILMVPPTLKMALLIKKEVILGSFKKHNISIYTIV